MSDPVLVSGAAGFIGSRMVESLRSSGIPVVSVDSRASFEEREEHRGLDFGTVVDREELLVWLSKRPRLSAIVHLGARTDTTLLDAEVFERLNLAPSRALWEHASGQGIPLIYASSAATYGGGEQGYDDDESRIPLLSPLNPYGDSKQRFDVWALAREREGVAPPSWSGFKFFNVYGFGERHKGRMSSVILQSVDRIRETGKVRLFRSHREGIAHGEQKRDFVWVGDVVRVLRFALERPIRRGIFNLGTGRARTFLDLARAVFRALGRREEIEFVDTPADIRDRYQYFTEARMERLREAGYADPMTELEDGVRIYVERLLRAAPSR
jgi:ADP-L-glycero-D-manno-heptose 6-epimerase